MSVKQKVIAGLSLAVLSVNGCTTSGSTTTLTPSDRAAIAAVDSAYVTAWLADDTAGVMATLAPDAVLMPAGQRPLTDDASIRAFWWPQDGSRTRVTALRSVPEEIEGSPSLAFVRGTAEMEFEYFAADSSQVKLSNRVMTLTILAPDATGHWRIKRRMWGPLASATR